MATKKLCLPRVGWCRELPDGSYQKIFTRDLNRTADPDADAQPTVRDVKMAAEKRQGLVTRRHIRGGARTHRATTVKKGLGTTYPGITIPASGFRVSCHHVKRRAEDFESLNAKAIIDGLRYCGVLPDDSPDVIKEMPVHTQEISQDGNERTVLTITWE